MKKLILITFFALCALVGMSQTFDYQVKGWQLQTDTSYVEGYIPETIGTLFWDKENHTISVILEDGVKGQMFQEIHIYGKNTSGVVISNGMAVSLTTNPSQFATFEKTDISNVSSARAFVGLATEDIGVNEFGYVTISGNVRDIPMLTVGLTEKNPVYVSTTPGLLTSTMPNAPNICILVGNCERSHATQGRINVNSFIMPRLQDLSDINGTPLTTKGQIPVWDQTHKYFDFNYNIWPDLISNESYGSSWDGVDSVAPSKNAIYDKIQSISGGSTNLGYTASATNGIVTSDTGTDATIPAGSTTNASLMLPDDKTKLNGIASGADNYGYWAFKVNGGSPQTVPSANTLNFIAGTNTTITRSGFDLTFSSTGGSMVYPSAGIPISTGTAWGTSITNNSSNWNTAYGWGNHASQGYVNSILINGTSGENAGGFLDFIPGSGINITKTGGHVTIAATGGSMVYPSAGLAKSTGSGWGTSITDNSSNWNDAHSNMGKTSTDGSFFAYLNPSYFTSLGGWKPTTLSEPTPFSDKAFSAGGAYTALNAKQDALSGTGFVKISGTTISYDNNTYALLNGSLSQDFSGRSFLLPNSINVNGNDGIARLVNGGHSFALFSNGDASVDGIFTASELYRGSSKELKHNIKPYKGNALDILNTTKIYTYNLNSDNSFGVGFLAEDTHKWLSGENQKSHAMGNHLGLLTKAIQEQIIVIEEMQKQISDLQIEIKKLKKRQLKRK